MSATLPTLVLALTYHHDAWIVGSAAAPGAKGTRDYDVIVPPDQWPQAAMLIPKDAKPNTFRGWKCISDDIEVDVWPGDLGWLMRCYPAKWAWQPRSGVRLQVIRESPDAKEE